MEIMADRFINELAYRTLQNYEFVKSNCKLEGLFEVTQLINSMYCLIVVPEEVFGYKPDGRSNSQFSSREKNLKKYDSYRDILSLIKELEEQNRIKYPVIDDYVQEAPVTCLLYNMRNALCHENIGFLPITSGQGKNEITDIVFETGRGEHVKFIMVLQVSQLERLLMDVGRFYSDIERGKASANYKEYTLHYLRIQRDLDRIIGDYKKTI
jgi:hypothetical protein